MSFTDEDEHFFIIFLMKIKGQYGFKNNFSIGVRVHGGGLNKFLHKIDHAYIQATGSIVYSDSLAV